MRQLDSLPGRAVNFFDHNIGDQPYVQSVETITRSERLPFTVRLVRNEEDLLKAVWIRHAAYARHVPAFASTLTAPEDPDRARGVVVLLAESKVDGSPIGTMRIQTNQFQPLALEQSVELPKKLATRRLAEATRLGVTEERVGRLVKTVLFKAFYLYCRRNGIEAMVATGRSPIDRQYERLQFEDVFPEMGYIPLAHCGNLPHRVMSFDVGTAEARWRQSEHPLFQFIVKTNHYDIDIGSEMPSTAFEGSISRIFPKMRNIMPTVLTDYSVNRM